MHKFSDFATEDVFEGDKLSIDEVLNNEVEIINFKINQSKFQKGTGKCLTIQVELNNEKRVIFTGSEVLMKQFEKYKDELPFVATIKKIDKYYTLS